mmetsp:Transcript_677/g.2711  ORF Transcript_677/g.2711 Transcript_677/m.2711 type:complete len:278 (+) Transcript_677:1070-1903(+)
MSDHSWCSFASQARDSTSFAASVSCIVLVFPLSQTEATARRPPQATRATGRRSTGGRSARCSSRCWRACRPSTTPTSRRCTRRYSTPRWWCRRTSRARRAASSRACSSAKSTAASALLRRPTSTRRGSLRSRSTRSSRHSTSTRSTARRTNPSSCRRPTRRAARPTSTRSSRRAPRSTRSCSRSSTPSSPNRPTSPASRTRTTRRTGAGPNGGLWFVSSSDASVWWGEAPRSVNEPPLLLLLLCLVRAVARFRPARSYVLGEVLVVRMKYSVNLLVR